MVLVVTVSLLVPPVLGVFVVCFIIYVYGVDAVDRSNRQMKRLSNAAMSPILSNVSAVHPKRDCALTITFKHAIAPSLP